MVLQSKIHLMDISFIGRIHTFLLFSDEEIATLFQIFDVNHLEGCLDHHGLTNNTYRRMLRM